MEDPRNRLLTWCETDLDALRENLATFRSLLPASARLLLVVKANAYGHGLSLIGRRACELGADWLGVHLLEEAVELRAARWSGRILVMGYIPRRRLAEAAEYDLDFTVYDPETVAELDRLGRRRGAPLRCHLKLETGTYRQGVGEEELEAYLDRFAAAAGSRLAGVSTHFANIEDTTDHSYARLQLERFRRMVVRVTQRYPEALPHAACSAAILVMPETGFALGRVGIGAYGIWPSRETLASSVGRGAEGVRLRPALAWKARVAQVKWVAAGASIGYGCTHRTTRRTRLAVVPVGYADGYDRRFSNLAHILLPGGRARVVGRVCMNLFMADATDLGGVEAEDVAVLLGRRDEDEVRAADLSAIAQTIPYEILCRISPAIPRLPVDGAGRLVAE